MNFKCLLPGLAIMTLAACAGYQPMGSSGTGIGYQEHQLSASEYRLRYVDSRGLSSEQEAWVRIEGLWNRRATELCGGSDYQVSELLQTKPCRTYYLPFRDTMVRETQCFLELEGRLSC